MGDLCREGLPCYLENKGKGQVCWWRKEYPSSVYRSPVTSAASPPEQGHTLTGVCQYLVDNSYA